MKSRKSYSNVARACLLCSLSLVCHCSTADTQPAKLLTLAAPSIYPAHPIRSSAPIASKLIRSDHNKSNQAILSLFGLAGELASSVERAQIFVIGCRKGNRTELSGIELN